MSKKTQYALGGALSGAVNGLFGGGGGMVLVPWLARTGLKPKVAYATCVAIIWPLCLVSAVILLMQTPLDWPAALPYFLGGAVGGAVGGHLFRKVENCWLRRLFGAFLLYGGVRYLL